jgi:hypothetical protein
MEWGLYQAVALNVSPPAGNLPNGGRLFAGTPPAGLEACRSAVGTLDTRVDAYKSLQTTGPFGTSGNLRIYEMVVEGGCFAQSTAEARRRIRVRFWK